MSITLSPRALKEQTAEDRFWTVAEFYQAAAEGRFDEPGSLELIHGRIVEKMPTGPLHTTVSYDLAERLREAVQGRFLVREERAIHIAFDGEPIPDIALVEGKSGEYRRSHPAPRNVRLLVEVSVTSVEYDLGEKALLYAQADIAEYWVVLAETDTVVVHREPSPEGYQNITRLSGVDTLSPLALPEAAWTINELLGRSEVSEES